MKKITLSIAFIFTMTYVAFSQCTTATGGQWPTTTINLVNSGAVESISTNNWPNAEFSLIENVSPGSDYTVTANPSTYITVTNTADDAVIAHGADSVSFTAPAGVTGLTIYWHLDATCGTATGIDTMTTIQCTTCTCSFTVGPNCVTEIAPANNDPSAEVGPGGSVTFTWNEDPDAESYELFINGFSQGARSSGITFTGFDYGTAYTWSVVPSNCFDTASGCPTWSFTTEACTETAAPGVQASNPFPADGATDVSIQGPDGGLDFNWTASAGPEDFYTLNIGTSNPPTQALPGVEPGEKITGLAVSTTYFWSIDVVNCFGATTGTSVWSFTTASTLSVEEVQFNDFKVYPNPTSNILNIKSTKDIDNVEVFDLLGKNVASFTGDAIDNDSIDLSQLSKGLYLVKISAENSTKTIRVTKD